MIFVHNGVRCAFDGNSIAHKGPRGLIPVGTIFSFPDGEYQAVKIEKSEYIDLGFKVGVIKL